MYPSIRLSVLYLPMSIDLQTFVCCCWCAQTAVKP